MFCLAKLLDFFSHLMYNKFLFFFIFLKWFR